MAVDAWWRQGPGNQQQVFWLIALNILISELERLYYDLYIFQSINTRLWNQKQLHVSQININGANSNAWMLLSNISMCCWCRLLRQLIRVCYFNRMFCFTLRICHISLQYSLFHQTVTYTSQVVTKMPGFVNGGVILPFVWHVNIILWPDPSHIISWWTLEANIDVMSGMQIFHDDIQPTRSYHWSPAHLPKRYLPKLEGKRAGKHKNFSDYFSLITTSINLNPYKMLGFGHIYINHVSILQNTVNFSHYGHVKFVGHVSVRDRISAVALSLT